MNELSQFLLPTLKTGDMVKLVLSSGSITGKMEEYWQDVDAIDISDVYFSGVSLPFIFTISINLIRELVKL